MKRGPLLLDTGFLVALVNSADPAHHVCAGTWSQLAGPFLTCEGVLVEAAHLVRKNKAGFATVWGLVRSVGTIVSPSPRPRIARAVALMQQFADVPMDFVDATLVALAEETGVRDVLTLDSRGFSAYRTGDGKKFKRLP
jgi:predicted nucleic acid-binding protein